MSIIFLLLPIYIGRSKKIFEDVNNFFASSNIYWNLIGIKEYTLLNKTKLRKIAKMTRENTPDNIRLNYYQSLISKNSFGEYYINKNTSNIYFSTFNGSDRQGKSNINKNNTFGEDIIMTMVGTWTNKPYELGKNMVLISRLEPPDDTNIQSKIAPLHQENKPSLSFTIAHELAHTLGLDHIEGNNNLMNSISSSSNLTFKQKNKMRTIASGLIKIYNKMT